jgi:hydrogenase expression/formation protein HypD
MGENASTDLMHVKATGADVRVVYSPLDALKLAQANPSSQVVFFAIGFETTAPATAMAVYQAHQLGLQNFSVLVSHVLVPPAMEAILASPQNQVQEFLAAGHVCAMMGYTEYEPIAQKFQVPIVDLAMAGARPLYLKASFILEEGLAMETFWKVVQSMQAAAQAANVDNEPCLISLSAQVPHKNLKLFDYTQSWI